MKGKEKGEVKSGKRRRCMEQRRREKVKAARKRKVNGVGRRTRERESEPGVSSAPWGGYEFKFL